MYARSTDGGVSFAPEVQISSGGIVGSFGVLGDADIVALDNKVYIVWREIPASATSIEIIFRASFDEGANFGPPVNLSNTPSVLSGQTGPQMVAIGDNIYVGYTEHFPGNNEVMFVRSDNNGNTFFAPVNLSSSTEQSGFADIAVSGTNVYVTFAEDVIFIKSEPAFIVSHNSGETFGNVKILSDSSTRNTSGELLGISGENVYVLWIGGGIPFLATSVDNGDTFDPLIQLVEEFRSSPAMDVLNDNVYMAWQNTISNPEISFLRASR